MKRLLILLMIFFLSCKRENKIYTLQYVVFYPNYRDTQTVSSTSNYYWFSQEGTNYIKRNSITGITVYSGSSPYKIISYTSKDINDE